MVALWMTLRLEGDRWWIATVLLIAPRWPFLLPLGVLWAWSLGTRRWVQAGVVGISTWVVLAPIMGLRVWTPGFGGGRHDIRLVSCNVHRQHLDVDRMSAFVSEVQPDVVTLQGWSETGHGSLFADGKWNVRHEGELLIASRFPISSVTPLEFADTSDAPKGERGAAALVELQMPGGPVSLITLHLASPHAGLLSASEDGGGKLTGNLERRWRESRMLREMADRVTGPMLMSGDFNTTDDSPMFRENWGTLSDAFSVVGSGFGYTYLVGHTQIRIDHVLANASWQFESFKLGPDIGSPHRPMIVEASLR